MSRSRSDTRYSLIFHCFFFSFPLSLSLEFPFKVLPCFTRQVTKCQRFASRSFFLRRDAPTVHQCKIDLYNRDRVDVDEFTWWITVCTEQWKKKRAGATGAATVVSFFAIDRVFSLFPSRLLPQHLNGHVYLRSIKAFYSRIGVHFLRRTNSSARVLLRYNRAMFLPYCVVSPRYDD